MSRRNLPVVLSLLFLVAGAPSVMAKSHTPKANTHDAVKAYVEQAAKIVARKGAACDTFKGAAWKSGDWYVFVIGPDDRAVCHPDPAIVGKLNTEIVDANGKNVGEGLKSAVDNKDGRGWFDYVWPRPGTKNPVPKSSYVVRVKGPDGKMYLVGSGGYELK